MKDLKYFIKEYLTNRPLFFSFIRPQEAYLFKKYAKLKKPILDFGCGDGFFAKTVFGKGIIDLGLDVDGSRISESKLDKVYKRTAVYDGKKIPFKDGYFKTVISNCVLEHIDNLDQITAEIYRVLKPNCFFYVSVATDKWEEYLFGTRFLGDLYKKFMRKKQHHYTLLSKDGWRKKFTLAEFKIEKAIGYIPPKTAQVLDAAHYFSLPSIISHKLFKKWVIFPSVMKSTFFVKLINNISHSVTTNDNSAALFFQLRKKK